MNDRHDEKEIQAFTKGLLDDLTALERILDQDLIEAKVRRIGAEQEVFLVDEAMRPALTGPDVLERLQHPRVTRELGLFNLEINLEPRVIEGDCLWRMEQELEGLLAQMRLAAASSNSRVLLTGILPTLRRSDLTLDSMTPNPRYRQLNDQLVEHRGGRFQLNIRGIDELHFAHDNVMCEACNTSFQVHFQADAREFVELYNLAQAVTGPVLAAAVNSPVFLQHRLWGETRVALFQQSVDTRSDLQHRRQARPRVIFGDRWMEKSVLEIYREDVARFRVLVSKKLAESPLKLLADGKIPRLEALCLHNGTVYRWNRPCYGVMNGQPHLRIEHRVLPSGPTVIDEMANAAFFFGLMSALSEEYGDVTKVMSFEDAQGNFLAAARYGLKARLQWIGGKAIAAEELILDHLLPLARRGLAGKKVRSSDVDRYLGVLEERVKAGQTGSQWAIDSLARMKNVRSLEKRYRTLTASMYKQHLRGRPVHEWDVAPLDELDDWRESCRTVEQVMTTDLFTVHAEDLVNLAANLMDWEHIRHVPVEDNQGRLVGLVSHRQLLRLVARGRDDDAVAIRDIMVADPVTVRPETDTLTAIDLMRTHQVSCLPVVDEDRRLVGIVSERDFVNMVARFVQDELRGR